MTLIGRINSLAQAIGADIKSLTAQLNGLSGGSAYTVTTLTRAAVQAAIDAAPVYNGRITLAPGVYSGFDASNKLSITGKTNLTLQGFGTAEFSSSASNDMLWIDGGNANLKILGVRYKYTGSGNANIGTAIRITWRNGGNDGIEIAHCFFTSPTQCQNAISGQHYSPLTDQGDGTGALTRNVNLHDNTIVDMGRIGIELVNHSWNDGKTDVYLKGVLIHHNYFRNLGTVAETDGTKNGMAVSISGYVHNANVDNNIIVDPNLLGIELAGTFMGTVVGNNINFVNNSFTGISVSDNGHNATKFINVTGNNVRSKVKCLGFNQVREFAVGDNTFYQDAASSTGATAAVYFQACSGGTYTGGSVMANCYNPVRLDDTSNLFIGGGLRIKNNEGNGYTLISIYGNPGAGNGSFNNTVGTEIYFEKYNGPATGGVVESYGNASGTTGVR